MKIFPQCCDDLPVISLFTYTFPFPPAIASELGSNFFCDLSFEFLIYYDHYSLPIDKCSDLCLSRVGTYRRNAWCRSSLFPEMSLTSAVTLHKASVHRFSSFIFYCNSCGSFLPQCSLPLQTKTEKHLLNLFWYRSFRFVQSIILRCLNPLGCIHCILHVSILPELVFHNRSYSFLHL